MQKNRGIFRMKSQDFGSATANMLLQFSWEPREPNSEKYKQKLHKFLFLAKNWGILRKSQDFGSATANMLLQFSWEPWQPNSEKYKQKLHKFLFLAKNWGIFRMFSRFYGLREFKYATWIFKGVEGVAMATKFGQKSQNCTNFNSLQEI